MYKRLCTEINKYGLINQSICKAQLTYEILYIFSTQNPINLTS